MTGKPGGGWGKVVAFQACMEPTRRSRLRRGLLNMAILLLLAVPAPGGQTASLTPSALPPLGGDEFSFGRDINNGGFVVGDSRSDVASGEKETAVVWDPDGIPMELARLDPDTETFGRGINDVGEVVGISRTGLGPCSLSNPNATETAVKWSVRGAPMELSPLPGDFESRAFAINNNGVAVGRSLGLRAPAPSCIVISRAVVWDRDGNPTALPTSLVESFALAINENGEIAGGEFQAAIGPAIENTLVWAKRTYASTILPLPVGGLNSFGRGINNSGLVIGESSISGTGRRAVLWDRNGNTMILQPLPTGSRGSRVHERFVGGGGINNRGTAVGWSKAQNSIDTAVVWNDDGIPTALPPLPGELESFAYGINDAGQIVGTSQSSQGGVFRARATIWR